MTHPSERSYKELTHFEMFVVCLFFYNLWEVVYSAAEHSRLIKEADVPDMFAHAQ